MQQKGGKRQASAPAAGASGKAPAMKASRKAIGKQGPKAVSAVGDPPGLAQATAVSGATTQGIHEALARIKRHAICKDIDKCMPLTTEEGDARLSSSRVSAQPSWRRRVGSTRAHSTCSG